MRSDVYGRMRVIGCVWSYSGECISSSRVLSRVGVTAIACISSM